MNDYDFSTLNDRDFELLTRDLLNAHFSLELQSFKQGKDKGIDLRWSSPKNSNEIVVQAKHYRGSTFSQLKHALCKKELPKIKKLKPERYLIATSLPLSASEKDELVAGLSPYVKTANDVFDRQELNRLIGTHDSVERRHFKLWFSSSTVLKSLLNSAVEGKTRHLLDQVESRIKFYVVTDRLSEAISLLNSRKILAITGMPGVGKTTLAEMVLLEQAKRGTEVYLVDNTAEAESSMSPNDKPQLFFFDDFLGSNYLDLIRAPGTESQFTRFVDRIKSARNKYLILTTRTLILTQAVEASEKIRRLGVHKEAFELNLDDYSLFQKGQILYNHLFFREVPRELREAVVSFHFYREILEHENYSPRIIEFVTDPTRVSKLSTDEFRSCFRDNLNNPSEIWAHSFLHQIDYLERVLLITLLTLSGVAEEVALKEAYRARMDFERKENNQVIVSNQFELSIRALLDGFILRQIYDLDEVVTQYKYVNPSLMDYLLAYVTNSQDELTSIVKSTCFIEQLNWLKPIARKKPLSENLQHEILEKIRRMEFHELRGSSEFEIRRKAVKLLIEFCSGIQIDEEIFENLVDLIHEPSNTLSQTIRFVSFRPDDFPKSYELLRNNFIPIIERMMKNASREESLLDIPELFKRFNYNFQVYSDGVDRHEKIREAINRVLGNSYKQNIADSEKSFLDIVEVEDLFKELQEKKDRLEKRLLPTFVLNNIAAFNCSFDRSYWEEKIEQNQEEHSEMVFDISDYEELEFDDENDELLEVDNLFYSLRDDQLIESDSDHE